MTYVNFKKNGSFVPGTPEIIVPAVASPAEALTISNITIFNDGTINGSFSITVGGIKLYDTQINANETLVVDTNFVLTTSDSVFVTTDIQDLNIYVSGIQEETI